MDLPRERREKQQLVERRKRGKSPRGKRGIHTHDEDLSSPQAALYSWRKRKVTRRGGGRGAFNADVGVIPNLLSMGNRLFDEKGEELDERRSSGE